MVHLHLKRVVVRRVAAVSAFWKMNVEVQDAEADTERRGRETEQRQIEKLQGSQFT